MHSKKEVVPITSMFVIIIKKHACRWNSQNILCFEATFWLASKHYVQPCNKPPGVYENGMFSHVVKPQDIRL